MYVVKNERRAVWRRKATDGTSQEPRLFAQHDVLFRRIGRRTDAIAVGGFRFGTPVQEIKGSVSRDA